MAKEFEGKVVYITGAAKGQGKAIALAFAKEGADIIAFDLGEKLTYPAYNDGSSKDLEALKAEIEALGRKCVTYAGDVRVEADCKAAVEKGVKELGRIDILINNAGTGAVAPAEDITDEQFGNECNIDLFGSFRVARAVAKQAMIPAKYGRVINIASMYGLVGNKIAGSAPYHAAKGGVVNLTRALAAEWGKYGITVNSICPGYFYTDLTRDTLNSDFFQQNAKTMITMERYGEEGELDSAALFFASKASSYVTGTNLAVDGGYTCM